MGKLCSCGLPMMARGTGLLCAHCDSGRGHVTSSCVRCTNIKPPKL